MPQENAPNVQESNVPSGKPGSTSELMPACFCGKGVRLWSSLLEQGFCGDEHYEEKAGKSTTVEAVYVAHGVYQAKEKTDVTVRQ